MPRYMFLLKKEPPQGGWSVSMVKNTLVLTSMADHRSRKWLIIADISDISDSIYQDLMAFNGNTMVIMGLPSGYFKSLLGASLPTRDLMSDQSVR